MRNIKFRGKTNNMVWVYGDLEIHRKDDRTLIHCYDKDGDYYRQYDVIPETISQYTGLKDANNVEIYDGDILYLEDDEVPFGCVAWHHDGYFAIDRHFGKYDFSRFKCRPLGEMLNRELDNGVILRFVVNGNIYELYDNY